MLSLAVLLIGLISYTRLSVREYPKIDEPVVSVETVYKGASAEVVESTITKPLEDSLSGIEGVDVMTSQSRAERSQINVKFKLTSRSRIRPPRMCATRSLGYADGYPRLRTIRSSPKWRRTRIRFCSSRSTATNTRRSKFPTTRIATSSRASRHCPARRMCAIFGERKMSMRIWLDRSKLAAYKLGPADIEDALRRQNVEVPAGRIESQTREFSVLAQTDLQTPEQFNNIVIKDAGGYPVRLRDVARAEIAPIDERISPGITGETRRRWRSSSKSTANPLELSVAVRAEAAEIQKTCRPE